MSQQPKVNDGTAKILLAMGSTKLKQQFAANFARAVHESEYRELKGRKLGKVFGVSGAIISQYKTGKKMPSMERGALIAIKLGVNVEWLLTNRGPMRIKEGISCEGATLLAAFEAMPEDARRDILSYAAYVSQKHGDKMTSHELQALVMLQPNTPSKHN